MEGMNKVILVGRLGNQPELTQDRSGRNFTRLQLATNRKWRDSNGRLEERTSWHRVLVWGRPAEVCSQFLKSGAPVMIEGYLNYFETLTPKGEKRWHTSVTAERVKFLPFDKRSGDGRDEAPEDTSDSAVLGSDLDQNRVAH